MNRTKFLTGLISNAILILVVIYTWASFFSWSAACLTTWNFIEPSSMVQGFLYVAGVFTGLMVFAGLLKLVEYLLEATHDVFVWLTEKVLKVKK